MHTMWNRCRGRGRGTLKPTVTMVPLRYLERAGPSDSDITSRPLDLPLVIHDMSALRSASGRVLKYCKNVDT